MSPRVPAIVLAVLAAVILFGRLGSTTDPVDAAAPQIDAAARTTEAAEASRRRPMVEPLPGVANAPSGTPTMDLQATLAARRRIAREGVAVYLDSMFATTDSTVVRWRDRSTRQLLVHFMVDTSVVGWSGDALVDALAGMQRWNGNAARIGLERTESSERADITVMFVSAVIDDSTYGVTEVNWIADGTARSATIRLALNRTDRGPPLPREVRVRVAAHEFGHALGLPHSGSNRDLMFRTARVDRPSRRDQATLQLLYAVPPGTLKAR